MPFDYRRAYPADEVEARLPGPALPPALVSQPGLAGHARRAAAACRAAGVEREAVVAAVQLGVLRMALRYGEDSADPLAYHNEGHLLELLEDKLPLLLSTALLPTLEREALVLFCACHDLRQREARRHAEEPIGPNEAASMAEADRLLDAAGLEDPALRTLLRFAIAGSTFAAGTDEGQAQGAFAHVLGHWLDGQRPGWRDDALATQAEHLARMAADLDTSNVASPYPDFARSAIALAIEIQHRAGRPLDSPEAGASCLGFLAEGQERYVFSLQRFASREGRAAFGTQRDANTARVRETSRRLREHFATQAPRDAHAVILAFRSLAAGEQ